MTFTMSLFVSHIEESIFEKLSFNLYGVKFAKLFAEVSMEQIVDIHCHILPGVDDGASSMEETISMLEQAVADGITTMIATPHYHLGRKVASYDMVEAAYQDVLCEIEKRKLPLRIYLGNEIFCSDTALEDITKKKAHTMDGTRYILLEFHPGNSYRDIRHGVHTAIEEGYIPIVAHAERYQALAENIDRVDELVQMGCYIQLNAADIMGAEGFRMKQLCKKLLKEELVHFVATDAHKAEGRRTPKLCKCVSYIEKKYGKDYAKAIFETNPMCVLQDKYL